MEEKIINDEKKIEELERELNELKVTVDEDLFDKEFNKEIDKLKEEQENEIKSLKNEINKLKKENNYDNLINFQNQEFDETFLKILEEKIVNDIVNNKFKAYLKNYEKKIEIQIKEIKDNINLEYNKLIESQFNEILSQINKDNKNIKENFSKNIETINENIKNIKKELNSLGGNLYLKNIDNNNDIQDQKSENSISSSNFSQKDEKSGEIRRQISGKNNRNRKSSKKPSAPKKSDNNITSISSSNSLKGNNNPKYFENELYYSSQKNDLKQEPNDNNKRYSNKQITSFKMDENPTNSFNTEKKSKKEEIINNNSEIQEEVNEKINVPKNSFLASKVTTNLNKYIINNNDSNKNHGMDLFKQKTQQQPKRIVHIKKTKNEIKQKPTKKYLTILKRTFFQDNYQRYIKNELIKDYDLEELSKEVLNDRKLGEDEVVKNTKLFIETRILPIIQENKISEDILRIVKYNIGMILKCLGLDEKLYVSQYYPKTKPKIDRRASQEAVIKFRNEFGIGKDIIKDNALEDRLIKNNLNLEKTFQEMYD